MDLLAFLQSAGASPLVVLAASFFGAYTATKTKFYYIERDLAKVVKSQAECAEKVHDLDSRLMVVESKI